MSTKGFLAELERWRCSPEPDPKDPPRFRPWPLLLAPLAVACFVGFYQASDIIDPLVMGLVMCSPLALAAIFILLYDLFQTQPSTCRDPRKAVAKFIECVSTSRRRMLAYTHWLARPGRSGMRHMPSEERGAGYDFATVGGFAS